jgi:hypothetical protein
MACLRHYSCSLKEGLKGTAKSTEGSLCLSQDSPKYKPGKLLLERTSRHPRLHGRLIIKLTIKKLISRVRVGLPWLRTETSGRIL